MRCQHCGITLPSLGDVDYKKAAEMENEIARLKAVKDRLIEALEALIAVCESDSTWINDTALDAARNVVKEVSHDEPYRGGSYGNGGYHD